MCLQRKTPINIDKDTRKRTNHRHLESYRVFGTVLLRWARREIMSHKCIHVNMHTYTDREGGIPLAIDTDIHIYIVS